MLIPKGESVRNGRETVSRRVDGCYTSDETSLLRKYYYRTKPGITDATTTQQNTAPKPCIQVDDEDVAPMFDGRRMTDDG